MTLAIALLPLAAADDAPLVEHVVRLVNAVYAVAEAGFWSDGRSRTDEEDVSAAIAAGELLAATQEDLVVGVLRLGLDGDLGRLGMLAVDPDARGAGIGGALLGEAERLAAAAGAAAMQLEVLTPVDPPSPDKARLDRWYQRVGYAVVGEERLEDHHPELAAFLLLPAPLVVYRKPLVTVTG